MEGVLAGLAIATALKDLIELGVKLKEFCGAVDHNNVNLSKLADNVLSDLQGLDVLYQQDPAGMRHSPELKDAANDLHRKIGAICEQFEKLSAGKYKPGSGFLVKLKASFKASDVEREIKLLKEDVSNCYQYFQLLASAHINNKVNDISKSSQQTQNGIAKVEGRTEHIIVVVEEIRAFISDQRLKIPDMKTEVQLQLNSYGQQALSSPEPPHITPSRSSTLDTLTRQIDHLYTELPKATAKHTATNRQPSVHPLIVRIPVFSFHRTRAQRNRRLLRKVLDVLENLEDDATAIEEHAFSLNTLFSNFAHLNMSIESSNVINWAIEIYRTLSGINPPAFQPFLARSLANLAHHQVHEDAEGSLEAVEEATNILRPLATPDSGSQLRYHYAWLLTSRGWITYHMAGRSADPEALRYVVEGVDAFEAILDKVDEVSSLLAALKQETDHIEHLDSMIGLRPESPPSDTKDGALSGHEGYLFVYQWALNVAATLYRNTDDPENARHCLFRRCIVLAHLATAYPETTLDIDFAESLLTLVQRLEEAIPPPQAIKYVGEASRILRRAYHFDPEIQANRTFRCLRQHAQLLQSATRREEAQEVWQQMLSLDHSHLTDKWAFARIYHELAENLRYRGCYEDAAFHELEGAERYHLANGSSASSEEVDMHLAAATDFERCGRYDDALKAALAVVQRRRDLVRWTPYSANYQLLSRGLTLFSKMLAKSSSPGTVVSVKVAKDTIDGYDTLIDYDKAYITEYLDTISSTISDLQDTDVASALNMDMIIRLQKWIPSQPDLVLRLQDRVLQHGRLISSSLGRPVRPKMGTLDSVDTLVQVGQ